MAGRITGLAAGDGYLYVGGAAGGVFRSADGGKTWSPLTDGLPTLSVGDLRLAPDGALWLATGEANTGATSYVGSGVYRLAKPETALFATTDRVGGSELESTTIGKVRFDGNGTAYAATSRGVWKHSAAKSSGSWRRVLYPVPDPVVDGVVRPDLQSPYNDICNDVAVDPNRGGRIVIANCAWRDGAPYNGFYLSSDGGESFALVNPTGGLNPQDVGRTTFAYSSDGSRLYALVESMAHYTHSFQTALSGVYVSPSGRVDGPWNKIAGSGELGNSSSALHSATFYHPGIQAWYNQFLAVDPDDPDHVFVGLEEVYESGDGGTHWTAVGPYWNFDFSCWSFIDSANTCPPTTHPDQHSIAIADGRLYVGDDGGVYTRPLRGTVNANGNATDWQSLNANVRTLQYYSVAVGKVPGGVAVAGGLQDNGGSLLLPEDLTGAGTMGSPFGGDGGDTLVDPDDGCRILGEYVFLAMELTLSCGRSDGTFRSVLDLDPHDPNPRFIAPFEPDTVNGQHWVAAGQYVWTNTKGWAIRSGPEWVPVFNNGSGHSTTVVASQNDVIWTAWCGPCNVDGFARGVSTNAGGAWRQVALPSTVPNRYISGLAIDPADPTGRTAYLGFNGFSRRFLEGPGAGYGHLWKTADGGASWADVSGNLPDVPVNDVLFSRGKIVVATDLGVVISGNGGAAWSRLGSNLPYTTALDITVGPDGKLYAATHGRGIWSIAQP
ncbi:MAG: glycosyl hydrolase [Acidobacteria bacterium]|nr:MAG: glycosyl hydrolase [Acidobacteriota bacterium]